MTPIAALKATLASMDAWTMYSAKDLRAVVEPAVTDLEGQIAVLRHAAELALNAFEKNWAIDWDELEDALANTHEAATAYLAQVRRGARDKALEEAESILKEIATLSADDFNVSIKLAEKKIRALKDKP